MAPRCASALCALLLCCAPRKIYVHPVGERDLTGVSFLSFALSDVKGFFDPDGRPCKPFAGRVRDSFAGWWADGDDPACIHDTFDALSVQGVASSRNLEVANNVLGMLVDNGIELEEHSQGMRIHDNYVRDVWEPFSWQPNAAWPILPDDAEFHLLVPAGATRGIGRGSGTARGCVEWATRPARRPRKFAVGG